MTDHAGPSIDLASIPGAFEQVDDLPRPQWPVIEAWIKTHAPRSDRATLLCEAGYQWLEHLGEALPGEYAIDSTSRIALLTPQTPADAANVLRKGEETLTRVEDLLGPFDLHRSGGKHFVLILKDLAAYCTYTAHFFPPGEYGTSAAMYLDEGFPHVAIVGSSVANVSRAMIHEFVHAALSRRTTPQWLEEGIAQVIEQIVLKSHSFTIDHDKAAKHRTYSRRHGLDGFWKGDSFHLRDDGSMLSYELAEILVRNMIGDFRDRFMAFVEHCDRGDCGEGAARDWLGLSLADCAAGFLGRGDWAPPLADPPGQRAKGAFSS